MWFEGIEQVVEVARGAAKFRARLPSGTSRVGEELTLTLPDDYLRIYQDGRLVA